MKIAVIGEDEQELCRYLADCAMRRGLPCTIAAMQQRGHYDVVLAAPGALEQAMPCEAYALVAHDGEAVALARQIQAKTVITYGTEKSTLCLSSAEDVCIVALQREIISGLGGTCEIGEVCLPGTSLPGDAVCGAAGALMVCGWADEEPQ